MCLEFRYFTNLLQTSNEKWHTLCTVIEAVASVHEIAWIPALVCAGLKHNSGDFMEDDMKRLARPFSTAHLSGALDHRLNLYSLAASAAGVSLLALSSPAQARIVFTPAHIRLTPNHRLAIDLNHDGVKDFELVDTPAGSFESLAIHPLQVGNALAQANGDCNPSVGVAALKAGVPIGKGQIFSKNLYCMAQYIGADGGSLGPWAGGIAHRYVGARFMIKGKAHFGWIRLSVSRAPFVAHMTGYAYETIPNKPIIAGKTNGPEQVAGIPAKSDEQTASLGMLAMGSSGLSIWRRKKVDGTEG